MSTWYPFSNLTPADPNSLQAVTPADGAKALGVYNEILHHYVYDISSTLTESIPNIVTPDGGTGRWLRRELDVDRDRNGFPDFNDNSPDNDTTIAFDDGTRTFTISPVSNTFKFFIQGKAFYNTGDTVVINDVEGVHWIYFDTDGDLKSVDPGSADTDTLILTKCLVASVRWDATNSASLTLADERHGSSMSPMTHYHLHETMGAQWESGGALTDFDLGGTGTDANAQFGVTSCEMHDEDLEHTAAHGLPQNLNAPAEIPLFYKDGGSGVFRKTTANTFPVAAVGGTIAWNEWTGAVWQLTALTNNKYVNYHYFMTNNSYAPIIGVPGQAVHNTAIAAQLAAEEELLALDISGAQTAEIIALGTVIWKCNTAAANAVDAVVIATQDGDDYVDWRQSDLVGTGSSTGSHNTLGGIQGGAVDDYFHLTAVQEADLTDGGDSDLHKHDTVDAAGTAELIATAGQIEIPNGQLRVGVNHVQFGTLTLLSNPGGSSLGGIQYLYTADDYDAVIAYYRIGVTYDDLTLGPATDPDSLKYNGGTGKWEFTGAAGVIITGLTEFSTFPVTPSSAPTTDYQTANKKYVDDELTNATAATKHYERQVGSDGGSANTVFDIAGFTYATGTNTLVVYVNGQKVERVASSPADETEYVETDSDTITFGASLFDSDVVEFYIHGNYTITDTDNFVPKTEKNNKNLIINGGMQIAQRGTTTGMGGASLYGALDRWGFSVNNAPDGRFTMSQDTDVPTGEGFANSMKLDCTTVGTVDSIDLMALHQNIEGVNLQHLRYGTADALDFTFSFWFKSDTQTGDMVVLITQPDATRSYTTNITVPDNVWNKYIITVPGDTSGVIANDTGAGMQVAFLLSLGASLDGGTDDVWRATGSVYGSSGFEYWLDSTDNNLWWTGCQMEVGDTATPFESRLYAEELLLCFRYYIQWDPQGSAHSHGSGYANNTTSMRLFIPTPVQMRDAPTIYTSGYKGNGTTIALSSPFGIVAAVNGVRWIDTITGAGTSETYTVYYASGVTAYLDAEL